MPVTKLTWRDLLTMPEDGNRYEAIGGELYVSPPPKLPHQWVRLGRRNTASPKLWMDAYLAAFALTAGYRMVTGDAAFRQFAGLNLLLLS